MSPAVLMRDFGRECPDFLIVLGQGLSIFADELERAPGLLPALGALVLCDRAARMKRLAWELTEQDQENPHAS